MGKKILLSLCMVFSILIFSNSSIAHAEENNGLDAEKINEMHKEYISAEFGDEAGFVIESYGESGIGSRSARGSIFAPPSCPHLSDLFDWSEYTAYTWNSNQHTLNTYRAYTYSCGCSGTVKMTNNAWTDHVFQYIDKGHNGDNHYYDYTCRMCGYVKYTRYYSCSGLTTGKHVKP